MSEHVALHRHGAVAEIRLSRPDKRNAITRAMYAAMADALAAAEADAAVRCHLISGEGASFTAGNDLADFMSAPSLDPDTPVMRFLRALSGAAKPVVAAVQGNAIGIGTTMLLHCDMVVLAEDATLRMPFVDLGLVPEAASSLILPRLLGHPRAAELLMLGEALPAARALAWGLANRVAPAAELHAVALELAGRLASKAPNALRITKALMRDDTPGVASRLPAEGAHFAALLASPELKEAVSAFFEKRAPDFSKAA
jgi:enoyl-CoA hydratase/carnithine racemase